MPQKAVTAQKAVLLFFASSDLRQNLVADKFQLNFRILKFS